MMINNAFMGGTKVKNSRKTQNKSIKINLQLRFHLMVELNFSAIIAEELHINQAVQVQGGGQGVSSRQQKEWCNL